MVELIYFYGFLFYLIGIIRIYLVNLLYKDLNILGLNLKMVRKKIFENYICLYGW